MPDLSPSVQLRTGEAPLKEVGSKIRTALGCARDRCGAKDFRLRPTGIVAFHTAVGFTPLRQQALVMTLRMQNVASGLSYVGRCSTTTPAPDASVRFCSSHSASKPLSFAAFSASMKT